MKTLTLARIAVAALALAAAGAAHAQNTTGQVVGRVLDAETGKAIPGATVTASGPAWIDQSVTTDAKGYYAITWLPPARYAIRVRAPGYAAPEPGQVWVAIDWRIRNDVRLSPARAAAPPSAGALAQNR